MTLHRDKFLADYHEIYENWIAYGRVKGVMIGLVQDMVDDLDYLLGPFKAKALGEKTSDSCPYVIGESLTIGPESGIPRDNAGESAEFRQCYTQIDVTGKKNLKETWLRLDDDPEEVQFWDDWEDKNYAVYEGWHMYCCYGLLAWAKETDERMLVQAIWHNPHFPNANIEAESQDGTETGLSIPHVNFHYMVGDPEAFAEARTAASIEEGTLEAFFLAKDLNYGSHMVHANYHSIANKGGFGGSRGQELVSSISSGISRLQSLR